MNVNIFPRQVLIYIYSFCKNYFENISSTQTYFGKLQHGYIHNHTKNSLKLIHENSVSTFDVCPYGHRFPHGYTIKKLYLKYSIHDKNSPSTKPYNSPRKSLAILLCRYSYLLEYPWNFTTIILHVKSYVQVFLSVDMNFIFYYNARYLVSVMSAWEQRYR